MKRILLLAVILLAGATAAFAKAGTERTPSEASAQGVGTKPQIEYFDSWEVRCFPIKSVSPCDMLFETVRKTTHQRVTSVSIAYAPSQNRYLMQVAVPYGVALSEGLVITAGDFKTRKLAFRRCDRAGCYVEMAVGSDLIDALKAGGDGHLDVVADRGKPVSLAMSLKGFGSAREAMVDLANQKATSAQPAAAANDSSAAYNRGQ